MAESVMKSHFPSQTVGDDVKLSMEYGLEVARAIENEWFKKSHGVNRFFQNQNNETPILRRHCVGNQRMK